MQQSNTYIIIFTAVLTIVVGGLLSLTSQVLAPAQKLSVELDTKTSILGSVMNLDSLNFTKDQLLNVYDERIESLVVDINGNEVTETEDGDQVVAEDVKIANNFKKAPEERLYPVYKYMDPSTGKVEAYILPLYGSGLWDRIWGYVALKNDLNTITGVSFDHKAETPGLGARISTPQIQQRYIGKKIYNENGELVSVKMVQGEGNSGLNEHQVDGMSGATITGRGLNTMLENYLKNYQAYFQKVGTGA